jgi:hypothetical protein
MAFHARHPVTTEVEDTVYACRNCGAELIRTSVRHVPRAGEIKSAEAA